jgi:hypothetical protein
MVLGCVAAAGTDSSGWQVIGSGEDQREAVGKNHRCKYIENDLGSESGLSSQVEIGRCWLATRSSEMGRMMYYQPGMVGKKGWRTVVAADTAAG